MNLKYHKSSFPFFCLIIFPIIIKAQTQDGSFQPLKAHDHPMQYYLSLPKGWNATKSWPVIVICEAAEKQYKENAIRFIKARGDRPYILVAPFIVTNGNQGLRDPEIFPYATETWNQIDRDGTCTFDLQGIDAVLRDITQKYNGESQVYITGFEAGAHLAWAMAFLHPERLKGAIVVAGNFRNRCLNDNNLSFSNDKHFPIVGVVGAQDTDWASGGKLYSQWLEGKKLATQRGYDHIIEKIIPQKGHEPMPKEVLEIIDTFLKANK